MSKKPKIPGRRSYRATFKIDVATANMKAMPTTNRSVHSFLLVTLSLSSRRQKDHHETTNKSGRASVKAPVLSISSLKAAAFNSQASNISGLFLRNMDKDNKLIKDANTTGIIIIEREINGRRGLRLTNLIFLPCAHPQQS